MIENLEIYEINLYLSSIFDCEIVIICAEGAGFPEVKSLKDLYDYNNTCSFYARGRSSELPFPFEGSSKILRKYLSKELSKQARSHDM